MQLTTRTGRAGSSPRDERGFTLVEVLVVIVILGIIVVPLGNAVITYFQNSNSTNNRLSESHDAQLAAAYFAQDVQSVGVHDWTATDFPLVQSVEVNVGPTQGLYYCGSGIPNAVVRLSWDDPTADKGAAGVVRVAYVVETVNGQKQLHRIECNGSAQSPTLVSDLVIAHNIDSVDAVTCSSTCTGTTPPQTVTLTLHLRVAGTNDPILDVTLTGQRRPT